MYVCMYVCICICMLVCVVSLVFLRNVSMNLLGNRECLVVELLDKLGGHLVGVVGRGIGTLLLQEVNFDCHRADALPGLVKVVV